VEKDKQRRQNLLQCLVLTKEDPAKIRRSERQVAITCVLAMAALLIGPILYFRDFGFAKYVFAFCSVSAGLLAMFWQSYTHSNQSLRDLHEFIDFDKVKSVLEEG
jgi:hypothetical protein